LTLKVVDVTGCGHDFCATLYALLPSGSLVKLGGACGLGEAALDARPLARLGAALRDQRARRLTVLINNRPGLLLQNPQGLRS
jgi:sugar/nucleoside kinase (ribokinase family)